MFVCEYFCDFKKQLKAYGYEPGPKSYAIIGLNAIGTLAILVISSLGAAGILPGSTVGWVAIGLSGGGFMLTLAIGNVKKRKYEVIAGALITGIFITLGGLGIAGALSTTQVGWGMVGLSVASFFPLSVITCFKNRKTKITKQFY